MSRRINVVFVDRVVVRENGVDTDYDHHHNPDTGTHALRNDLSLDEIYWAAYDAGTYDAKHLPREVIDQLIAQMPLLDVNLDDEPAEDEGGLFG